MASGSRKKTKKGGSAGQTKSKTSRRLKAGQPSAEVGGQVRVLNARPDGIDFRDRMYIPTLVEVPSRRDLEDYLSADVPVLDQGPDGACTGFGLATVAHYLLRTRKIDPEHGEISPYMLYDMARRYDEWAGEAYDGSSCRGAMKGWYKHGVCSYNLWDAAAQGIGHLSHAIAADAALRPVGAYYRVNHKDLVAVHAAITETGVLYASAIVHAGWQAVGSDGEIALRTEVLGGHAFAIVAYDREGFWIQNSWGADWGRQGFGHISYQDWLENGTDIWAARLGVAVDLPDAAGAVATVASGAMRFTEFQYSQIRPHVISIGNDGQLDAHGDIGTSPAMVREILRNDFPRITANWKKKRLVLYAHGGLVSENAALQRVAEYLGPALDGECYPLAFIWKSDYWTTLKDMLTDATRRRRPEGFLDGAKDFMLDRLDDALEPIARALSGKASWDEMKENALMASTTGKGGARVVADEIARLAEQTPDLEIHLVGHSAGSILHAPLIQYLTTDGKVSTGPLAGSRPKGLGLQINTCTLWAPACTMQLFNECYRPAIEGGGIGRFTLFTLTDKAEQDDNCARVYNKSLLYLVSDAFESTVRIPLTHPDGEPILGMEKFITGDTALSDLISRKKVEWVRAPNNEKEGTDAASGAKHHGDFDDDPATVKATMARVIGVSSVNVGFSFARGRSSNRALRRHIEGEDDATRVP